MIATILQRVQHSASESVLLQIIAHAANIQCRNARLSYEVLAARSGFSIRWCITLVARLESRNLLRVRRTRLGYAHCAINVYDVVCPWRRDLTYQEALERRQAYLKAKPDTARLRTSERQAHREPTREKIPLPTDAELARIGVYPGSPTYARAKMLDPPP